MLSAPAVLLCSVFVHITFVHVMYIVVLNKFPFRTVTMNFAIFWSAGLYIFSSNGEHLCDIASIILASLQADNPYFEAVLKNNQIAKLL